MIYTDALNRDPCRMRSPWACCNAGKIERAVQVAVDSDGSEFKKHAVGRHFVRVLSDRMGIIEFKLRSSYWDCVDTANQG